MTKPNVKLVTTDGPQRAEEHEGREEEGIELGQWYWLKSGVYAEDDPSWLGCITWIGSNYVKFRGLSTNGREYSQRVHLDEFDEAVLRREWDPDSAIQSRIQLRQRNVERLMDEIKQLTAGLGITPAGALPDPTENSTALVAAHNAEDVQAHKKALIKAKEETLPELFAKVKAEHQAMATWMKAKLIPMEAEAKNLKESTSTIEDRIFTVELYAGLCEELTKIRKGKPAGNDEKIHLLQRRHYMDEECLVDYAAGGMEFRDIKEFDRWLMKKGNRARIFPFPKCAVAFQVRREAKEREATSLGDFIHFADLKALDERTFLYLRNGESYYRLDTAIDFGEELFPDLENSHLLGGQLYLRKGYHRTIATEQDYQDAMEEYKERRKEHRQRVKEWKKQPKKDRGPEPWFSYSEPDKFEPLNPDTVYYDDGMKQLSDERKAHNRIAVVLQGLIDRSPAFHPHPPWHLWTPEGFAAGIELVYDASRVLTDGDAPDFEEYRAVLNATIQNGTHTIGQEERWLRAEAAKENRRQENDWRVRNVLHYRRFSPYGNPGPGLVAEVAVFKRNKGTCTFRWERERQVFRWVPNPDKPGYDMHDESGVPARFVCPTSRLLNVDAYTPGDYKQFYADPRTRADYLKWAPLLLAAEDWHAGKASRRQGRNEIDHY